MVLVISMTLETPWDFNVFCTVTALTAGNTHRAAPRLYKVHALNCLETGGSNIAAPNLVVRN